MVKKALMKPFIFVAVADQKINPIATDRINQMDLKVKTDFYNLQMPGIPSDNPGI